MRPWWIPLLALTMALIGLPAPAASQAGTNVSTQADWSVDDPPGDQAPLQTGAGNAVPENPASNIADLVGLTIGGEDELGFTMSLLLNELRVGDRVLSTYDYVRYEVAFRHEPSTVEYELRLYLWGSALDADSESFFLVQDAYGEVCFLEPDFGYCMSAFGVEPVLDDEANAIRVWIPKEGLQGTFGAGVISYGGETPSVQPTLRQGDRILDIRARSYYGAPVPCIFVACYAQIVTLQDSAPDAEAAPPPYELRAGSANSIIALHLFGASPDLAVEPGLNQSIGFLLENRAASKRLIHIEYGLEGPADKVGLYEAFGPTALTIPGGQARNFTLALRVDAGATSADGVRLVLRGTSLGHPDELAYAASLLSPQAALGPANNKVYLHAIDYTITGEPAFDEAWCATLLIECTEPFLSIDPNDPQASPRGVIETRGFPSGPASQVEYLFASMHQGLATSIAFDREAPIEITLKMAHSMDREGILADLTLYYYHPVGYDDWEQGTIFEETQTISLSSTPSDITFTGPVRLGQEEEPILPAGTNLQLILRLESDLVDAGGTAGLLLGGTTIQSSGSEIRLPLVELPEHARRVASTSPLQLSMLDGERDDYVNPGEARLYNVTVLNQDTLGHRAGLTTTAIPAWKVDVLPATSFDLDAGDAVVVGVLVHAPEGAAEGEEAFVYVNATDEAGNVASMRLVATVTHGVDLPDDSLAFRADEDALRKAVNDDPKGSPGPGALAVLGLVVAWVARRRRKA